MSQNFAFFEINLKKKSSQHFITNLAALMIHFGIEMLLEKNLIFSDFERKELDSNLGIQCNFLSMSKILTSFAKFQNTLMSGGHYGIDPRQKKSIVCDTRPMTRAGMSRPMTATYQTRPMSAFTPRYNSPRMQKTQFIKTAIGQCDSEKINQETMPQNVHLQFDKIMSNTKLMSLQDAIETGMNSIFNAENTFLWLVTSHNKFYSPTKNQHCAIDRSILSAVYKTKIIANYLKPSSALKFDKLVDSDFQPSLYIPIPSPTTSNVIAILQIIRPMSHHFTNIDMSIANSLQEKFQLFSHFIFHNDILQVGTEIATSKSKQIIPLIIEQLESLFQCRVVEFWAYDSEKSYSKYDESSNCYAPSEPGLVKVSFSLYDQIICHDNSTQAKGYHAEVDGTEPEAIMLVPFKLSELQCAICLRRALTSSSSDTKAGSFSFIEENQMRHLIPLIIKSILYESSNDPAKDLATRLKMLLDVAEILGGVMDIDVLVPIIMSKACSLLHAERCSLFLVDSNKQTLTTTVNTGLDKSISIPINRGIVGHTATTGEILIIEDAYNDARFDNSTDLATGFKTKTILSVPIYDNRGEIVGVTEMINREDGNIFDEDDIKMMVAFNVFCGISIDNTRLYKSSIELTRQLQAFVEMSNAINNLDTNSVRNVFHSILTSAKDTVKGVRASLFLRNEDSNNIFNYINVGEPIQYGTRFSAQILSTKKPKIYTSSEIVAINGLGDPSDLSNISKPEDRKEESSSLAPMSRISGALSSTDFNASGTILINNHPESICCFPLLKNNETIVGILEVACKRRKIFPEDMKLLDCFSVFISVLLEKNELQLITTLGRTEVELKKHINPNERSQVGVIPSKIRIGKADTLFRIDFDAQQWEGIGCFRVVWAIFDSFKLFREFKICNETFYKFLDAISHTYHSDVPYHNWAHAVDVTQFITYQIKIAKLETKFTKIELLALLVAGICHDASHEGFSNVFNIKAETPLGILFKNQSVMEIHHCCVAIEILSKEECNIFDSLDSAKTKEVWNLLIKFILTTDMVKLNDLLDQAQNVLDQGPIDYKNPDHRALLMEMLLKCADLSNVSRPFEIANKWCNALCEEFFRQGDLEKTNGMEFTSPLNDRAHLDKPKSQIGFYTYVCLPVFKTAARAVPALSVNADQVSSNLAIWKKEFEKEQAEKKQQQD